MGKNNPSNSAHVNPHGLNVLLVKARHVKTVPSRKIDVNDAQWLATYRDGRCPASEKTI